LVLYSEDFKKESDITITLAARIKSRYMNIEGIPDKGGKNNKILISFSLLSTSKISPSPWPSPIKVEGTKDKFFTS
jgi:hypothetical protein